MRDLTGGLERVVAPGRTVRDVILALDKLYPGIQERLCQGDRLDPTIVVVVDDQVAPLGLRQAVREDSEIRFLPALSGG